MTLSSCLSQGLQLNQPQQQQQQQQQQFSFQQQSRQPTPSPITLPPDNIVQQQGQVDSSGSVVLQQHQVLGTGSPMATLPGGNTISSVESQTQKILRQIQESLRKSQAGASPAIPQTSNSISLPSVVIKQETQSTGYGAADKLFNDNFVPSNPVKCEPNLIESFIKQEDVKPVVKNAGGSQTSSIHALLTNTSFVTQATTTVSQASTSMSMFVLSNSSQTVPSNTSSLSNSSIVNSSVTTNSASGLINSLNDLQTRTQQAVGSAQTAGSATMQKIHLPPELQVPFQRVQLEIRKVQLATNMTVEQKQAKLLQLQSFQKKILLKGRVLATTKTEPGQIQQGLASLNQAAPSSIPSSEQIANIPSIDSSQTSQNMSIMGSQLSTGQQQHHTIPSNTG